jgi:iron complex outermembrane receptor protein
LRVHLAILITTLFAGSAAAQQPADSVRSDTTAAVRELEPVEVTAARVPVAVGGASGLVVRPDSLRVPPAASLEQALRELPFVLVRQNARGETELSLRGSESRQVAVMLDGLPLTLGWDHRTDPSLVPLTGVRRLTLVRGLSSVLHGPNVLGGIVELELARGAPGASPAREAALGVGIDEYGARVLGVTAGAPLGAGDQAVVSLRGGLGYRARDGVALAGGVTDPAARDGQRSNSDLEQLDGFAAVRWQHPLGRFLGFTATGFRAERGVPPELHVVAPRLWRYPALSRGLAILSAGTGPVTTPAGFGTLNLAAGINLGSMEIESFESTAYRTVVGTEQGEERTLSARLNGSHTLPASGELRLALTGAEIRYDETLDGLTSRYRQRLWSSGLEAEWPVLGRALVGGGLVYDAASTPESGGKPALGGQSHWGWRLGATAAASAAVQLHASLSRRARFASLRELYSGSLQRFEPNPNLRPERLGGAEVGVRLRRALGTASVGTAQLTLFHHRLDDAVVRTTPAGQFRRENRDEIRSTGVELLAGWTRGSVAVTGDLLLQRVRVHDELVGAGARRPEHQPEVRGRFGVGVPLLAGVSLLTDLRYVGRQFCVHPELGGEVALPGNAEGDVALERTWVIGTGLWRSLRALLALDNVTDAVVYDQCGLPRPGQALRVSVQLR